MEVLQPEACSFCVTITSLSGGSGALWEALRSPAPPPAPPAPVVGWLLPFTPNSLPAAGQLPGEPGQPQGEAPSLQLDSLACWSFFACSGEVRSFGNWFLVPCFLSCLSCCLQLRLLILCLSSSLGVPPPSSFSVHLPLLWTTSYPRFEIIEI